MSIVDKNKDLSNKTIAGLKTMGIDIPYLKSGGVDMKTLQQRLDEKIKKPGLFGRMMGKK
jgi:hypothetical protein